MDNNSKPHSGRAVIAHLRNNAIETLYWPARCPDLNPIEHLWDYLGHQVQARDPPVRNLQVLEQALHKEWQRISMELIRCLVASMGRRLAYVPGEDTPDTDTSVSDRLVKHVYSLFKNNQTSNLGVWLFFLPYFCECQERHFWSIQEILLKKVSSKLKLPIIFVSVTSTHVDSHLVKTI